ncbi:helix-turn-helix domain-containing protein [Dechloromonas hortensis]|uniref:helix-turn-helix domain-containing protein n=1 Tax=Dechloromonas hortensis TaxID=337779 RepID=UPI00129190B9|nr:helix-turn-helix domain-containing protein [Dechloromonas hortensis]
MKIADNSISLIIEVVCPEKSILNALADIDLGFAQAVLDNAFQLINAELAKSKTILIKALLEETEPRLLKINVSSNKKQKTLQEAEREYIRYVLDINEGNKTKAARILSINRRTLQRKLA